MTFIYARSDDVGAPTLTGEVGSMVALLKACLVDGFGSKAAAGWTVPFEDAPNNVAVFRPDSGNRFFYRVQDDASSTRGARVATIEGFKSMIGHAAVDGTADFCGPTYRGYLCKSKDVNANTAAWVLFADDKKCWFFAGSAYFTAPSSSALDENFDAMYSFFGDYVSLGSDANSSVIVCAMDEQYSYPNNLGFTSFSTSSINNCPGDVNGIVSSTKLTGFAESVLASNTHGISWGGNLKGMLSPHPLTNDIHVCRLLIGDSTGSSLVQAYVENLRGIIPGALVLGLKSNPLLFEDYTINSKNYISVGIMGKWTGSKSTVGFLMNTDGLDF